jgi:PAS domain S-box-containing protein
LNDLLMNTLHNQPPYSSEQKFEALLEAAPDAMIIAGNNGIIQLVNRQAIKMFGYGREELIGQSIEILIPERFRTKHASHREHFFTSPKVRPMGEGLELFGLKKDGSEFFVEISLSPLQTTEELLISAAIRDITERKKLEERLKQFNRQLEHEVKLKTSALTSTLDRLSKLNAELDKSRSIYQTIASSIPGSVIVLFDHDYRYILIEGDLMPRLGYDQNKLLNNKAIDVLPPDIYAGLKMRLDRVFDGEFFLWETRINGLDMITRYVPIRNDHQQVTLAMVVVIDITELKSSQRALAELNASLEQKVKERTQQLEQVNSELESFTYSVSHDLRAPLRIIDGFADIMLSDFSNKLDDEGIRALNIIKNNARRMGQLIDDLLNLSRYSRKEPVLSLVNMNTLVREVVEEQKMLSGKPIDIYCESLPPAWCDRNLLRQVWTNLVSNAIKYSAKREHARIQISAIENENEVVYAIKDNGVGFNMQYAAKLFGVFQRLHKQTEYEGTGVGLALVHKIITRHNGAVWAEAEPDKGAVFYFSLPIKQKETS